MEIDLKKIEVDVKECKRCKLCENRTKTVFGVGPTDSKIGEGPGADEDKEGEPFVGKAGKLMDMAFQGLGIDRNDVYICNIVKCRPPNNRTPLKEEAEACLDYLRAQVMFIKPQIIVLLGNTALKNILGERYGITSARGKWIEKKGILYMPTFHPAALLRDESKKIYFWEDLKKVMEKIKDM